MNMNLTLEETLRDASDEEIRNFILETLLELLDLARLLRKKPSIKVSHFNRAICVSRFEDRKR